MASQSPIDRAVQRQSQLGDAEAELAAMRLKPVPPDPELDSMFREFAKRMPAATARPFVEFVASPPRVEYESRGLFRRSRPVSRPVPPVERKVGRGWVLGMGAGRRVTIRQEEEHGYMYSPALYGRFALGVTNSGRPWFVLVHGDRDEGPVVGAGKAPLPIDRCYLGRLRGVTLRAEIIHSFWIGQFLVPQSSGPGVAPEGYIPGDPAAYILWARQPFAGLPDLIAEAMAKQLPPGP